MKPLASTADEVNLLDADRVRNRSVSVKNLLFGVKAPQDADPDRSTEHDEIGVCRRSRLPAEIARWIHAGLTPSRSGLPER